MPRLVAAKEASLAVIPPASALAQFITHRVRCHFTLPGTVSMENLIMPPTTTQGLLLYPQSRGQVAQQGLGFEGSKATWESSPAAALIKTDHSSVTTSGELGPYDPVSSAGECFLLGFLGLATSLASLRVSLPTEPLIKRGFV